MAIKDGNQLLSTLCTWKTEDGIAWVGMIKEDLDALWTRGSLYLFMLLDVTKDKIAKGLGRYTSGDPFLFNREGMNH